MSKILFRFNDRVRPPPPTHAELHPLTDYIRNEQKPSKYVTGCTLLIPHAYCPICDREIEIDHGQRIRCECGLLLELWGNGLSVWREVGNNGNEPSERAPVDHMFTPDEFAAGLSQPGQMLDVTLMTDKQLDDATMMLSGILVEVKYEQEMRRKNR